MNAAQPALLASLLALVAVAPDASQGADEPYAEPPLEVSVRVGDETLEVPVGGTGRLSSGAEVAVDFVPHRTLRCDALEFEYPREWLFSAAGGLDAGWWTVIGDGVHVHVKRLREEDPAAAVRRYVDRMEANGGTLRGPAERVLGGRALEGETVRTPILSIGGGGAYRAMQHEVFATLDADGAVWIIDIQRAFLGAPPVLSGQDTLEIVVEEHVVEVPADARYHVPVGGDVVDAIAKSWRWLGGGEESGR